MSPFCATDARVNGQDQDWNVGQVAALEQFEHGGEIGKGGGADAEALQISGAVGLDARVNGQDQDWNVGQVAALEQFEHGGEIGKGGGADAEALQISGAVGLEAINDLAAGLFGSHDDFAFGIAVNFGGD